MGSRLLTSFGWDFCIARDDDGSGRVPHVSFPAYISRFPLLPFWSESVSSRLRLRIYRLMFVVVRDQSVIAVTLGSPQGSPRTPRMVAGHVPEARAHNIYYLRCLSRFLEEFVALHGPTLLPQSHFANS